jgi:hypothetical protein
VSYDVESLRAFKPNELGHDQNHGVVCSNDPILCVCVPLRIENSVHFRSFPFLRIKSSFSIFRVPKRVFCEGSTENTYSKTAPPHFS